MSSDTTLIAAAKVRRIPIRNPRLLRQALTHKSSTPDHPLNCNERLEFLGDSVLGMVINEYLYNTYPTKREGELAVAKAHIVCKTALAAAARRIDLTPLIRLGSGEEAMGGRSRDSIVADAFEAIIAVVYTESGFDRARQFIIESLTPEIEWVAAKSDWRDPKTVLQELRQAKRVPPPVYEVECEEGLPHDRTFTMNVLCDGVVVGTGVGKSKRDAEQAAAKAALGV